MQTKEELKKYMIDSYKDIFGDQYDEKRAIASYERILAENENLDEASKAAQSVVERTRNKVEQSRMTRENLGAVKEGLHDAPNEVKEAFNIVVGYFDIEYFGLIARDKENKSNESLNNPLAIYKKTPKYKLAKEVLKKLHEAGYHISIVPLRYKFDKYDPDELDTHGYVSVYGKSHPNPNYRNLDFDPSFDSTLKVHLDYLNKLRSDDYSKRYALSIRDFKSLANFLNKLGIRLNRKDPGESRVYIYDFIENIDKINKVL